MCEFCENSKAIISSFKRFNDRNEKVSGIIEDGKLKVFAVLQTAYSRGSPISTEAETKFCPMCGRKLSEV